MRDFSLNRQPQSKPENNTSLRLGVVVFGVVIFLFIIFFPLRNKQNLPLSSPNYQERTPKPAFKKIASNKELLEKIEDLLHKTNGSYSVYVYNLRKKEEFGINEEMVLTAASLNKIPILAALYQMAGKNEIDLEKIIVLQEKDRQDYGTGSMRYDPVGTPYSIKTLARLMMEQSDNTAAFLLGTQIIGLDKIQNLINSWGMKQTNINDNKTSAKDMSLLLSKMYQGEITNNSLTAEMLGFMDKTDFDDRIPEGLPRGTRYYHKTGDEIGKIHDVGIIDLPNNPYYLGILTIDVTDEEMTKKNLAQISKLVYSYMSNL